MQIQQNPVLTRHEQALRAFLGKYMSYGSPKFDLVRIYAGAFTADELNATTRF